VRKPSKQLANTDLDRVAKLIHSRAVSQQDYDTRLQHKKDFRRSRRRQQGRHAIGGARSFLYADPFAHQRPRQLETHRRRQSGHGRQWRCGHSPDDGGFSQQAIEPTEAQRAALDELAGASVAAAQKIKAACPTTISLTGAKPARVHANSASRR